MTDRLRSSKKLGVVPNWASALAALLLIGCSELDPASGHFRTEPVDEPSDADTPGDASEDGGAVGPGEISFIRDIRPLVNRPGRGDPSGRGCKGCHYTTEASHNGIDLGGLDMTTLGRLRQGGGSSDTRIIIAGKPNESVFVQVLIGSYPYAAKMPKTSTPTVANSYWSESEIKLVKDWITQGAKGADAE